MGFPFGIVECLEGSGFRAGWLLLVGLGMSALLESLYMLYLALDPTWVLIVVSIYSSLKG